MNVKLGTGAAGFVARDHAKGVPVTSGKSYKGRILDIDPLTNTADITLRADLVTNSKAKVGKALSASQAKTELVKDTHIVLSLTDGSLVYAAPLHWNSIDELSALYKFGQTLDIALLNKKAIGGRFVVSVPLAQADKIEAGMKVQAVVKSVLRDQVSFRIPVI